MAQINLMEQLFYKDENVIIHNIIEGNLRYFLIYPTNQQANFAKFYKLCREDNTKKGTSEYSNETMIRKQLLEDVIMANEFIKNVSSNFIHSRINPLKELPVKELADILDENKPFNIDRYRIVVTQLQSLLYQNYNMLTNSNIKNLSNQYAILCIIQKEQDKEFINYLNNNLIKENNHKNLEMIKTDYYMSKIQLEISNYKQVTNEKGKIIVSGLNSKNELFNVELPDGYNMLQAFYKELYAINNKSNLIGLPPKQIAMYLFDNLIIHCPSNSPIIKEETIKNEDDKIEQNLLNNQINTLNKDYLVDTNNNIAINQNNTNDIIGIQKNEEGLIEGVNKLETQTYEFDDKKNMPSEVPVIENGMKLTRKPPKKRIFDDNNQGFIKVGTLILFISSLILTITSLALLIAS